MRPFFLIIFYLGLAYMGLQFSSDLAKPEARLTILFTMDRSLVKTSYSDQDKVAIAAKVNLVWERIEKKLADVSPVSLEYLNGPASEDDFDLFERQMGFALPPDLEASLRRHNGSRKWFGVFKLNSVRGIVAEHVSQSKHSIASWEAVYYEDLFQTSSGHWEPGSLVVGINYFQMLVDTEYNNQTLIQSRFSYSGEHHDSFLDSLEYIADALDNGEYEILDSGAFSLGGWGCNHY